MEEDSLIINGLTMADGPGARAAFLRIYPKASDSILSDDEHINAIVKSFVESCLDSGSRLILLDNSEINVPQID